MRDSRRRCGRAVAERGIVEQDAGVRVRQDVRDLGLGEPRVDRYEDRTQSRGAEHHLQELGAVLAQVGHHVAGADAAVRQQGCDLVGAVGELPIRHGRPVAVDEGGLVRGPQPAFGQPGADSVSVHRMLLAGGRCYA
jgi:hypothetical protein